MNFDSFSSNKYKTQFYSMFLPTCYLVKKDFFRLSDNKYLQCASELIVYNHLRKFSSFVGYDVKLNPLNDSDVDVVARNVNGYDVRVEVKTPEINFENNNGALVVQPICRLANNEESKIFLNLQTQLLKAEVELANPFKKIQIAKIEDNKIKTYLDSAKRKFPTAKKNNEINCLLICLDTEKMCQFLIYYTNPLTGVFSADPFLKIEDYKNVDYVILTNNVEGHLDSNFNFNYWDQNNYINFILPTQRYDYSNDASRRLIISKIFPSMFPAYVSFSKNSKSELPQDMKIYEFISLIRPCFRCNKTYRKY